MASAGWDGNDALPDGRASPNISIDAAILVFYYRYNTGKEVIQIYEFLSQ